MFTAQCYIFMGFLSQFQIKGEIDDSYLENPAESLAYLLDVEQGKKCLSF